MIIKHNPKIENKEEVLIKEPLLPIEEEQVEDFNIFLFEEEDK